MDLERFEQQLHAAIPMTAGMGIHVIAHSEAATRVGAPLAPNHNHQGSAFGGSLYSLAVVSAWSALTLWCHAQQIEAVNVIQSGEMHYHVPALGDLEAECRLPGVEVMQRAQRMLARHGRTRLELTSQVWVERTLVAEFSGAFVLRRADGV